MIELVQQREFFADEIAAVANLKNPALIEALNAVPREHFLRPGPWLVYAETTGPRQTPDSDPRHVYHNVSVAIDSSRQLFNGNPGLVTGVIDALAISPANRVLHVGAGLGYYSALIGHIVGPRGRVLAVEIDEALANEARANVASMPWIELRTGDATAPYDETFDAILINAGVTHPQAAWLDALAPNGRLALPLTASLPAMGANIGKGVMVMIRRPVTIAGVPRALTPDAPKLRPGDFAAKALSFVAIYSGRGLRDDRLSAKLGEAMMRAPFPQLQRMRRDAHAPAVECWLHADDFCFSLA